MSKKRKILAGLFVVGALGGAVGVAIAAWSANGSGNGRASSVTAQSLTVTAATGTADLYPGFAAGDIYFTVTNPNPYPVNFTAFDATTITSSDGVACPASNVTVNDAGAISIAIAGNASAAAHSIADVVSMAGAAPDGCQGKTFTIALTLTGTQTS